MKIKSLIGSCIIALGTTFLWSCNNEETFIDKNYPPVEKGKLSFVLPKGGSQPVTYAANSDLDAEFKLSNIRIYWFDETSGKLLERFACGDGTTAGGATETVDGDSLLAADNSHETIVTITVGDYSDPSRFYIVANVNGSDTVHPDMITSDPLAKVQKNVTTCAEFEALLSDAVDKGGTVRLLGTPIPMSIGKASSGADASNGYIAVSNPSTAQLIDDVHLKRRVARFDVINTANYSNFKITRIAVARAQKKGWLFDRGFVEGADSWTADNTYKFEISAAAAADSLAFNGPAVVGADSFHLTKAAFYLYPTLLDKNYTKTEIILEGIYNQTSPVLYTLNLDNYPGQELAVEANKLYRIKVHRTQEQKLKFDIIVDHWDIADTIPTANMGTDITSWGVLRSSASPSLALAMDAATESDEYEYTVSQYDPSIVDTLTLFTSGTNLTPRETDPLKRHVTDVRIEPKKGVVYEAGDLAVMKATQVVSSTHLTYGTEYVTEHKIILPPTDAPIEVLLKISSAYNADEERVITLRSSNYAKTGYKPVKIGNLLWAPVNVGATKLPATKPAFTNTADGYALTGDHFQWGRNFAYPPFPTNLAVAAAQGPVALDSSIVATGVFIKSTTQLGNWMSNPDPDLWGGDSGAPAKAKGPCPAGWRIPTEDEWMALRNAVGSANSNGWVTATVTASGDKLYFPIGGYRTGVSASLSSYYTGSGTAGGGYYWTSTYRGTNAVRVSIAAIGIDNTNDGCAYGMSIRAVRDIPNP
ncbi:MAG: hypothetical protein LBH19_06290 [Dysgonamonadaceae bacterium]|jgi:uncharacterized protein (TIGR02145 family)|nr:hypothetical protein [Dysgonamonadaceae bacterium]